MQTVEGCQRRPFSSKQSPVACEERGGDKPSCGRLAIPCCWLPAGVTQGAAVSAFSKRPFRACLSNSPPLMESHLEGTGFLHQSGLRPLGHVAEVFPSSVTRELVQVSKDTQVFLKCALASMCGKPKPPLTSLTKSKDDASRWVRDQRQR